MEQVLLRNLDMIQQIPLCQLDLIRPPVRVVRRLYSAAHMDVQMLRKYGVHMGEKNS